MRTRKKKVVYKEDDGRTLYPVIGPDGRPVEESKATRPSKRERRAMIRAAYLALLPMLASIAVGFTAVCVILYLLLK